jgi:hypothetical protein
MAKYLIQSEVIGYNTHFTTFPTREEAKIQALLLGDQFSNPQAALKHTVEINGEKFPVKIGADAAWNINVDSFMVDKTSALKANSVNLYADIDVLGIKAIVTEEIVGYEVRPAGFTNEFFKTLEEVATKFHGEHYAQFPDTHVNKVNNFYVEIDACNDTLVTNCICVSNDVHSSDL